MAAVDVLKGMRKRKWGSCSEGKKEDDGGGPKHVAERRGSRTERVEGDQIKNIDRRRETEREERGGHKGKTRIGLSVWGKSLRGETRTRDTGGWMCT